MKFMMQDSIMVKDKICSAGSRILYNFKAPFSAAVYDKCIEKGFEFAGFVVSDEFGIDKLFDETVETEETAAEITAILDNKCDAILCNDVFGKLRRQASQNGLIYIQPAYGTVSRFGLIPSVSSMDQIGILCRNINNGAEILSVISGHDINDGTSLPKEEYKYDFDGQISNVASIPELKYLDISAQIFYILASAEISNNTNRYDGVKFGFKADNARNINDLYINTRSEGLGKEISLASIVGCMVLSQEYYDKLYHKAMQLRNIVKSYYTDILSKSDAILLSKVPSTGHDAGECKYQQLALYVLTGLCGFASVSYNGGQIVTLEGRQTGIFQYIKEELQ